MAVQRPAVGGVQHRNAFDGQHSFLQGLEIIRPALGDFRDFLDLGAAKRRLHLAHPVVHADPGDVVNAWDGAFRVRAVDVEGAKARNRSGNVFVL